MSGDSNRSLGVELINTGSELLLGRVLNTHQQWLCRRLSDLGYKVDRQVAVTDDAADIEGAVREALTRADLVITTGGLGPTCDDRTRERIAALLQRPLHYRAEVEAQIRNYFESRGRRMPDRTRVEAYVPEGAQVAPNAFGTAPGLILTADPNPFRTDERASHLIMLPGPPRELRPMFLDQVVPWLQTRLPVQTEFACRTLRTTGLGESLMEERLSGPLSSVLERGLELGFCARVGEVDVRLVSRGAGAKTLVAEAERIVRDTAAEWIFGDQDDQLEEVVIRELTRQGKTLAVAESCTGGFLSNRLTNVPGASAVFLAGLTTYANEAKKGFLGVRSDTLAEHGAVSEPTAREMAEGVRRATGADYALSTTGIAGPGGGTDLKPVGTVYMALSSASGTEVFRELNRFERETFKYLTSQQALARLLKMLRRGH